MKKTNDQINSDICEFFNQPPSPGELGWDLIGDINHELLTHSKWPFQDDRTPKNITLFDMFEALEAAGFELDYTVKLKEKEEVQDEDTNI
jgi:hypothetical protein